jgi:hypothetical protein
MQRLPCVLIGLVALICAPTATAECFSSPMPASCFALAEKAAKAQQIAEMGREKWAKVASLLIENPPPAWVQLPGGWVLDTYSGSLRATDKGSTMPSSEAVSIAREWTRYMDLAFNHNLSGHLTYDIYPCLGDCSAHHAGFTWAEENQVTDYAECKSADRSFSEGCMVRVTRALGRALPP